MVRLINHTTENKYEKEYTLALTGKEIIYIYSMLGALSTSDKRRAITYQIEDEEEKFSKDVLEELLFEAETGLTSDVYLGVREICKIIF